MGSDLGTTQYHQADLDILPRHAGMRGDEVADHDTRNAAAAGMIPVDRTDDKWVAGDLVKEGEKACACICRG